MIYEDMKESCCRVFFFKGKKVVLFPTYRNNSWKAVVNAL